ncbi:hypothetical protein MED297_21247 [Reinekea sp. MED297]|uniref:Metallo-beta-lactamase domain-containing protein n=2 Tax=Reinekea TaxID=230494 RepID=A4BA04_9GAMM|nr:hypothetical protein MED297_21247 [Reinekea sp. MED297] [Reinekea blandensis MED297]
MKRIFQFISVMILFLLLTGVSFMFLSPQFGSRPSDEDRQRFEQSNHFNGSTFDNMTAPLPRDSESSGLQAALSFMRGTPGRTPKPGTVDAITIHPDDLSRTDGPQLYWFGHSSFMLQLNQRNFLFDPVFADVAAPHPWLGSKRYSGKLPIQPDALPRIDAVFISHDHYDHLDLTAIRHLIDKAERFYVPLGVGTHLRGWGVEAFRIVELDWWQNATMDELTFTLTPAQHFSGRRLTGQNQSLWGGWHLRAPDFTFYFSGDSGYNTHFKEIRNRLGPVDVALLECGQYNTAWADVHMMPEETVQAARDLDAAVMMPVHWGAFTLSIHAWNEPAQRVVAEARKQNQSIIVPRIGERVDLRSPPTSVRPWWDVRLETITPQEA